MESLDATSWDVVIAGTGIQQSLLALSLSRTNLKVLHLDRNDYYGGAEAALSLQEAEAWVQRVNNETGLTRQFSDASIDRPHTHHGAPEGKEPTQLSFSRAYSLALAPQVIYSRSDLLSKLVSSKVYRQLEFLAVGSWFTLSSSSVVTGSHAEEEQAAVRTLKRIPSSREDVFTDASLDLNGRRRLMKFLRFIADYEQSDHQEWQDPRPDSHTFPEFLERRFGIPRKLQDPIIALTSFPANPAGLSTDHGLKQISQHLRSIGVFGRGFGSVISKWGGLSEIVQVGCRAAAVGGATYVLDKPIISCKQQEGSNTEVQLRGDESVTTKWLVGCGDEFAGLHSDKPPSADESLWYHTVSIIGSPLPSLFPATAEGSPAPAGAIVYMPHSEVDTQDEYEESRHGSNPVYLHVHSSDTGECPVGQSVIYASVPMTGSSSDGLRMSCNKLESAVSCVLKASSTDPAADVIWRLGYAQRHRGGSLQINEQSNIITFPDVAMGVNYDDGITDSIKQAWATILGDADGDGLFMIFEDREEPGDMADDYDDS